MVAEVASQYVKLENSFTSFGTLWVCLIMPPQKLTFDLKIYENTLKVTWSTPHTFVQSGNMDCCIEFGYATSGANFWSEKLYGTSKVTWSGAPPNFGKMGFLDTMPFPVLIK